MTEETATDWGRLLRQVIDAGSMQRQVEAFKQTAYRESEKLMSNNSLQPGPTASITAGDRGPTRIEQVENMAQQIQGVVVEIEHRLHSVVERLDGSRPTEASDETAVDQPGVFGSLSAKQNATRQDLDRCLGWLNEIEQLV